MIRLSRLYICSALLTTTIVLADDIPELSADQTAAMETITRGTILSTVSFLSSDEMAGRDTPSTELRIASAYVAARFRGAGLEGGMKDGSFFHTHDFQMSAPPAEAEVSMVDDSETSIEILGVLNGGAADINVRGIVEGKEAAISKGTSEIVVVDELSMPPQAGDRPGLVIATLARSLRPLTNKGVKVVLMKTAEQSVLLTVARSLQSRPIANQRQLRPACAVVLIDDKSNLIGRNLSVAVAAQQDATTEVRNVVGVLKGADEELSKQAILISAHLDHIGTQNSGTDRINNGADDNATGVTAVISLADAFGCLKTRPSRSIIFATFWGEEKGLLGSRDFASHPPWPLNDIVANVNIEMVGRPEADAHEKAWMTGWKHSNLGELMNGGAQRAGVEIFDRKDIGEMLYRRSDNYSLVQKGVVAHSFSAGSLHSDYHKPTDEWEKLQLDHMKKVIQGFFAGVSHIASGDVQVVSVDE